MGDGKSRIFGVGFIYCFEIISFARHPCYQTIWATAESILGEVYTKQPHDHSFELSKIKINKL